MLTEACLAVPFGMLIPRAFEKAQYAVLVAILWWWWSWGHELPSVPKRWRVWERREDTPAVG